MPGGLRTGPELKVLGPVVVPNAVPVVDRFVQGEVPAQDRLHHQDVFEHISLAAAARMAGSMDHQVAGVVLGPATSPVEVDLADLSVLCPAA
jgi:hypothetical protein